MYLCSPLLYAIEKGQVFLGVPMKSSRTMSGGLTQRQLRVGELVRRELAALLERGMTHDPLLERVAVTVTQARVSPDLRHAVVYCLPLFVSHKGASSGAGFEAGEEEAIPKTQRKNKKTPSHMSAGYEEAGSAGLDDVLIALNRGASSLRAHLGRHLSMKYTPALVFKKDESFENAAHIEALLKQPEVARDLRSTHPDNTEGVERDTYQHRGDGLNGPSS